MIVETLKGIRGRWAIILILDKGDQQSGSYLRGCWRRKEPMRFVGYFTKTARYLHRQEYIEANNTIVACIQDRPDQPGHTFLRTLESLVMKACIFFFCRVLHTMFSHLRAHTVARYVTVTRSSAVQTLSSRRQERRWAIVCGSPESQSTDWRSSR